MAASIKSLRAKVLIRYRAPKRWGPRCVEILVADGKRAIVDVDGMTEAELLRLLPASETAKANGETRRRSA